MYLLLECNDENVNKFDLIPEKGDLPIGKKILLFYSTYSNQTKSFYGVYTHMFFASSVKSVMSFMGYSFTKSLIVASSSMRLFPNPGVSMTVTFGRDLFPSRCPKSRQVFFVMEVSLRIKSNVLMKRIVS